MRNRVGNMLWGLFFILIGTGFLGNVLWDWDFELFFDGWWTLFIIVPCSISIVQRGPRVANLIGLSIGVLLLLSEIYDVYYWEDLIIPIVFIIIGVSFIFRNSRFYKDDYTYTADSTSNHKENINFTKDKEEHRQYRSYERNQATAVLSSRVIDYSNQLFEGIVLNSVIGGSITLDLRNAEIKNGANIDIAAVLGGVDIVVPSDVEVVVQQVPILGGVTNKTHSGVITATIYVNASCILGGVTIK
ncbi:cell wall-active antibiotic response 4TMS protein YvqF [Lachnotalea glycerini]|uniref:Cell wall-active antibiotic response 4TMS protein YvqF n=1 Tax=Lachnotalea glycerini TaxID=1763509 RepID=A0A255Q0L5_9FIRM|nr:LiaF domain-containing protein [Lachnotalea glycerini]OYP21391.1 hypothetical protein CG709_07740 [Lachnotalea glycerini]PXV84726.1 cell wall-active antibiotic response 4TMS protein YvqF [Lachnotalea glycerini]RDY29293.1 hypothetical protein CG710_018545 [Lachnotalea glycerini]